MANCSEPFSYLHLECRVSSSQFWVYYTTLAIYLVVSLLAFSLLLYYKIFKKSPLWNDRLFEPISGFLFWATLYSSFRALDLVITSTEIIPYEIVSENFINYAGWTCGQFAVTTYIVGTFKVIPKLAFHRPTENRHDKICQPTEFIPAYRSVLILYWSYIIGVGTIIAIFSCLNGYYIAMADTNPSKFMTMYKISQGCLLIALYITNIVCIFGLYKYGRLLVVLTKDSIRLVDAEKEIHKIHLKKLKVINFALTVIVIWSSLICLALAYAMLDASLTIQTEPSPLHVMILSFSTQIGSCIMVMAVIAVIIHSELSPRYTVSTEILNIISRCSSVNSIRVDNQNNSHNNNNNNNNNFHNHV